MKGEGPPSEPDVRVAEVVEALESRGCRPRRQTGGTWRARCPAHGRQNDRSLSVSERRGRVLTHCHSSGCGHQEVMSALGLDRPHRRREGTTEEYAYLNADGSIFVTIVREDRPDGKRVWRKPKGTGKPARGYPLLDLPSLMAAPEQPLLVVEGEKTAAHAYHLFGDRHATTTAIGGAGKAHQTDWSPAEGREIVIWPDADNAGQNHAKQVAEHCIKAGARNVRVVDTYGLPAGWDLGDLPPDGVDIEALLEGTDRFVLNTPSKGKSIEYQDFILTIGDLMEREEHAVDWAVDGLIPRGGVALITAKPKIGKSTLARELGLAVAKGRSFLGRDTCATPVLYVCLKDRWQHARRHLVAIGASRDDQLYACFGGRPDERGDWLSDAIASLGLGMAIIDPLFRYLPGITDANSYAGISNATGPIIAMARETGCALVLTHHAKKTGGSDGDEALGSTAIAGTPDTIMTLTKDGEYRQLATTQREGGNLPPTRLNMDAETQRLTLGQSLLEERQHDLNEEVMSAIPPSGEAVKRDHILKAVSRSTNNTVRSLNELVEQGAIIRDGEGKARSPFKFRRPNPTTALSTGITCSNYE